MLSKNNRKLLSELHSTLNFFRTIFRDDHVICHSIDESYEEVLMHELEVVPEQFDELILKYVQVVKVIGSCVDFRKLASELDAINDDTLPHFEINSLHAFEQGLANVNITKVNRTRTMNIVTKLKPIFHCIDRIVSMPIPVLRRIGEVTNGSNDYSNLL